MPKRADAPLLDYHSAAMHTHITSGVLFPKADSPDYDFPAQMLDPSDGLVAKLSDIQRKQLTDGDTYLVVYGKISYRDSFGPHWTQFCWWKGFVLAGTYEADNCTAYNQVDNKQP